MCLIMVQVSFNINIIIQQNLDTLINAKYSTVHNNVSISL